LNALTDLGQVVDHSFELSSLSAQCLCSFRVIPDFGVFQFPEDFRQTFLFAFEVKDTP
jgi:hypothetical protein